MPASQLKKRFEALEKWILENPDPPTSFPWQPLYRAARLSYAVIRDVSVGNLTLHAMGLVYTTLLSIVPMLALSFSVLKALGVHNRLTPFLERFFAPLGPQGAEMVEKVLMFVDNVKVGVLGSLGLALLVYTVISLVQKIEASLNMIWRVPQMRSLSQRFSNYLSVIMVGPLLMVSALGILATIFSSTAVQALISIEPLGSVVVFLGQFMPLFLVMAAFTFVYVFMPNTRVAVSSALVGAAVAGLAWQTIGVVAGALLVNSTKYQAIYSGFAIGIVLLIWLYINWLILLVGASIAYYQQNPAAISRRLVVRSSPELEERVAMALMWYVGRAFDRGDAAPQQEWLEHRMRIPPQITRGISDKLIRRGLLNLAGVRGDQLVPARSLDQIHVADVLKAVRADEEGLVSQLPAVTPAAWLEGEFSEPQRTVLEMVRDGSS